ncbi:hypothetical protein Tco_1329909 [Tanacetum coccineum]
MLYYLIGMEPYYIQCIKDGPFQPITAEDDIMEPVISCETVKATLTDLVHSFEGLSDTKENMIMDLKLEYQTFRAKPFESLSQTYTRYKTLLNELINDGVALSKHKIYVGFAMNKSLVAEMFDWDEEEVYDDEEITQVKVLMTLADDELFVGKNHACNGEWIDITMKKVKMDDPNITMEKYIRLEEEKARRRCKVYNWETATYDKIWDNEDIHDLGSVETEFPAIVFNDTLTSEATLSCEPTGLRYGSIGGYVEDESRSGVVVVGVKSAGEGEDNFPYITEGLNLIIQGTDDVGICVQAGAAMPEQYKPSTVLHPVLMRVDQEQKVTKDARTDVEQDVEPQRYATEVIREKHEVAAASLAEMENIAVTEETMLEATLQYRSGQTKAHLSPRMVAMKCLMGGTVEYRPIPVLTKLEIADYLLERAKLCRLN